MQSLWSTHRRSKLNLNSAPVSPKALPASAVEEPVKLSTAQPSTNVPIEVQSLPSLAEAASIQEQFTSVNSKRKLRASRSEPSSKRSRITGSGASGSIAKDYSPPGLRLSDLGGVEACIEKVLELVAMPLCHPEIYLHTGVPPPRGVLLHGPPGCGKTMLAHAIAGVSSQIVSIRSVTLIEPFRNLVCHSSVYLPRLLFPACPENQKRHYVTPLRKPR